MTEKEFIKAVANAISNAKTCEAAALNTYEVCCKAAEAWGMKPDIEVGIKKPGESRHFPDRQPSKSIGVFNGNKGVSSGIIVGSSL